jgi:hypothetical protein
MPKNTRQIRISPEAHNYLSDLAVSRGQTISECATDAVKLFQMLNRQIEQNANIKLIRSDGSGEECEILTPLLGVFRP